MLTIPFFVLKKKLNDYKSRDPFNKGKLIIIFNINFPEKLDPSTAKKIAALLPRVTKPELPSDAEKVKLEIFDGESNLS